jgi:hypothetical protein
MDTIEIGIKEWLAPQISAHWPVNIPAWVVVTVAWFNRPGDASIFTPNLGTLQE